MAAESSFAVGLFSNTTLRRRSLTRGAAAAQQMPKEPCFWCLLETLKAWRKRQEQVFRAAPKSAPVLGARTCGLVGSPVPPDSCSRSLQRSPRRYPQTSFLFGEMATTCTVWERSWRNAHYNSPTASHESCVS